MKKERTSLIIAILVFVIVVLIGVVMYALAIKPAINGYTVRTYNAGVQQTITALVQEVVKCQPVPIVYENTTINLIAVECLQAQE